MSPRCEVDSTVTTVKAYEAVSDYLGFGFIEAGKTMGLAPYGKADPNIPTFSIKKLGEAIRMFLCHNILLELIDTIKNPYLK